MRIFKDKIELVVMSMVVIYASFFLYYTLTKHYSFMTYMFDLGLYAHNLWLTLNYGDPKFPLGMIHQSQLLYLLIPFYVLNPKAETLLIIQALIIPIGAIFLYKLAKEEIGKGMPALIFAALYLLYPPLHGISQFDFHLEAFLPTLFIAAFYYYRIGKWRNYLISILLILFTMGFSSYLTVVFGLYLFLKQLREVKVSLIKLRITTTFNKPLKVAIMTIFLGFIFIILHHSYTISWTLHFIRQPSDITIQDRVEYIMKLYGPLAFIPIMSLSQIMALPWLSFTFLTSIRECIQIYNQYPAFILPFIFIGAIEVLKSLPKEVVHKFLLLMIITTTIYFIIMDPVFIDRYEAITPRWPSVTEKDRTLTEIINMIPCDASILTQNNIAPHLTNRREIYIMLNKLTVEPDYILIDKSHFSYDEPNLKPAPAQILPKLLATGKYKLKVQCGSIELYEKIKDSTKDCKK